MKLSKALSLRKAKYTRRTGSPGRYKYFYGEEGRKPAEAEIQRNLAAGRGTKEEQARKEKYIGLKEKVKRKKEESTGDDQPTEQQVKIMRDYEGKRNILHEKLETAAQRDNKTLVSSILKKLDTLAENVSKTGIPYYTGAKAIKGEKATARMILKYAKPSRPSQAGIERVFDAAAKRRLAGRTMQGHNRR